MDDAHFERLSAMDLSFLAIEDGRAHMHIGSVSIYEAEPLRGPDGGIDFERVLSFTEAQLPKFPRFRQRLAWVPGFAHPGWVDDDRFNLPFHLRHTALPAPGDVRQLKRLAGRILSQEFDRSKPLWENWFVDGLDGDRFAVISKAHHCMADGISGVAMGNLLVGSSPDYGAGLVMADERKSLGEFIADVLSHVGASTYIRAAVLAGGFALAGILVTSDEQASFRRPRRRSPRERVIPLPAYTPAWVMSATVGWNGRRISPRSPPTSGSGSPSLRPVGVGVLVAGR